MKSIKPKQMCDDLSSYNCEAKSQLFFKPSELSITAKVYCDILEKYHKLFCKDNMIFIQDHGTAHLAKKTSKWLEQNKIIIKKQLAKLPDINPIETI